MKKFLIILSVIFVLLLVAAFALPVLFKDDIKAAIDKELEGSVNATVLFDVDHFSLSVFTNFPNITANMREFGVVNRAPFDGEVLFAAEELEVEINLASLLFGDAPRLSGITLIRPLINIKVLEDGQANYDIAIATEEADTVEAEDATEFSFGIDHWEVVDGNIVYDDKSMAFYMKIAGMNHTGSGDFTQDVFDLTTRTQADSLWVGYEEVMYLEEKRAEIDATITISDDISRYTFKDNTAKLNDFALSFNGWFFMGEDSYDMDITYAAVDNTFKSLLSLVPGIYTQDFADIETSGNLSVSGLVKGSYSETAMPAFQLDMQVEDGRFQYPDLPTAVENIALDMKVNNPDGIIENTSVNIASFHMDLGSNPVDARVLIANLRDYEADANIKATLNLAELNTMFPVEGLEMKGTYALDVSAKGTYDSTLSKMPVMRGAMSLKNGYIKSADFPVPLEDLHFGSTLSNTTGQMKDFSFEVNDFAMIMDEEEFHADLTVKNLENYTWNLQAKGGIDLEKITQLFPLEGMALAGIIRANINTSGNYAWVEAEQYDKLPTSGSLSVSGFSYSDEALPYDVTISNAEGSFDPQSMQLTTFNGKVGESDMSMNGVIDNYMGYLFTENELLHGEFTFNSKYFNLNELMPETEAEDIAEEESSEYTVIPVPKNIDFVLNSRIDKLIYTDMEINNAQGQVIIKDGIANLKDITFNTLGGDFLVSGAYDTQNPDKPLYDFKLKVDELGIKESFQTFTIVKALAPMAKNMTGKVSTDFTISGELAQNFMPILETVSGSGLLKIAQAALQDSKLVTGLTSVTKLKDTESVSLKDVVMAASITDGKLNIKPFNASIGEYAGTISGTTGIDGSIAYNIEMEVPAGKFGSQLTSVTSQLGMGEVDENTMIPLNVGMGGTLLSPSFQLMSSGQKTELKDAVASKAKEEATEVGKEAVADLTEGTDAGKVVNELLGKKDSTQTDSTKAEVKKEVEEKAKDALKSLFKKKKNNE